MVHYTTKYELDNGVEKKTFNSEKEACNYLGVAKSSVSSCYRNGCKCKGYKINKIGITSHGETKTRLHKIWESMLARCEYQKHPHYNEYGGRGITVCEEWHNYNTFKDWAKDNGYSENLTIDRKNNNGNYEPDNCRWITNALQQRNKNNCQMLNHNGKTQTLSEWARELGINRGTLWSRINILHWEVEKALAADNNM